MTVYTATFSAVAVSAAQDLFEIVAGSGARIEIREIVISQYSDAADAQAEMLPILLMRGHTSTGSGGSTPTPSPNKIAGATAQATVKANNTSQASGGSPVTLRAEAFNVMGGYRFYPIDEERIGLAVGDRFVVRLNGAPGDSLTVNGTIVFEEMGLV